MGEEGKIGSKGSKVSRMKQLLILPLTFKHASFMKQMKIAY